MFGKIITKKQVFTSKILIGLIPSHKESPNFWRVISQLKSLTDRGRRPVKFIESFPYLNILHSLTFYLF